MPRLILQCADLAPVDQLIWSVWGFSVLEACAGGELCVEERSASDELAGLEPELAALGGVCVHTIQPADPVPDQHFAAVCSAGVVSQRLMVAAETVYVFPQGALDGVDPEWLRDTGWMRRFRQRVVRISAGLLGNAGTKAAEERLSVLQERQVAVSLISSVFKADRFLVHFLENCSRLSGYRDMEHWLIRPGSPGQEHQLLLEHARHWPGATYLNLGQDPGLYETWNLGCCLARGRYLSNANVDDVRHRDHMATLHALLEGAPDADVASAALRVTAVANQNWCDWRPGRMFYCDGEGDEVYPVSMLIRRGPNGTLAPHNRPHCMPLWRRALHLFNGFFNEREYGPSADWEFWLRCGSTGSRFVRTPRPLGMYLEHPQSYWHREGDAGGYTQRILARYGALAREGRLPKAMHPPAWRDLSRFLSAGNWLGVLIALLRLHAHRAAGENSNGSLVDRRARQLFGVELPRGRERLRDVLSDACGAEMRLEQLVPVLVDLLRGFCAAQGDAAERLARAGRWHGLLVDWHRLTGDPAALAGVAWLARTVHGDADGEGRILRALHNSTGARAFWPAVQRVYRHARALSELNAVTAQCSVPTGNRQNQRAAVRLWYYPTFSNAYQKLLYRRLRGEGVQVRGVASFEELEALALSSAGDNILHLHWLNAVFQEHRIEPFESRAERLLELVARRQQGRLSRVLDGPQPVEPRFRAPGCRAATALPAGPSGRPCLRASSDGAGAAGVVA